MRRRRCKSNIDTRNPALCSFLKTAYRMAPSGVGPLRTKISARRATKGSEPVASGAAQLGSNQKPGGPSVNSY